MNKEKREKVKLNDSYTISRIIEIGERIRKNRNTYNLPKRIIMWFNVIIGNIIQYLNKNK